MASAARLALVTSSEASSRLISSCDSTDMTMFIMICRRRMRRFSSSVSWAGLFAGSCDSDADFSGISMLQGPHRLAELMATTYLLDEPHPSAVALTAPIPPTHYSEGALM